MFPLQPFHLHFLEMQICSFSPAKYNRMNYYFHYCGIARNKGTYTLWTFAHSEIRSSILKKKTYLSFLVLWVGLVVELLPLWLLFLPLLFELFHPLYFLLGFLLLVFPLLCNLLFPTKRINICPEQSCLQCTTPIWNPTLLIKCWWGGYEINAQWRSVNYCCQICNLSIKNCD